jgi:hypothetical protein
LFIVYFRKLRYLEPPRNKPLLIPFGFSSDEQGRWYYFSHEGQLYLMTFEEEELEVGLYIRIWAMFKA